MPSKREWLAGLALGPAITPHGDIEVQKVIEEFKSKGMVVSLLMPLELMNDTGNIRSAAYLSRQMSSHPPPINPEQGERAKR